MKPDQFVTKAVKKLIEKTTPLCGTIIPKANSLSIAAFASILPSISTWRFFGVFVLVIFYSILPTFKAFEKSPIEPYHAAQKYPQKKKPVVTGEKKTKWVVPAMVLLIMWFMGIS